MTADVVHVEHVTARLRRVTLAPSRSDNEAIDIGAESGRNIKLYFPRDGQSTPVLLEDGPGGLLSSPPDEPPFVRTYTARSYDATTGHVTVDFVLHEPDGPASSWARRARPGTTVGIAGPRGQPLPRADWYVLLGDETALPHIATTLESLPAAANGHAFVEVIDTDDEQALTSPLPISWIHRGSTPPQQSPLLANALRGVRWPPKGPIVIWAAGESAAMQEIRRVVDELPLPEPTTVLVKRYWTFGSSREQRKQREQDPQQHRQKGEPQP